MIKKRKIAFILTAFTAAMLAGCAESNNTELPTDSLPETTVSVADFETESVTKTIPSETSVITTSETTVPETVTSKSETAKTTISEAAASEKTAQETTVPETSVSEAPSSAVTTSEKAAPKQVTEKKTSAAANTVSTTTTAAATTVAKATTTAAPKTAVSQATVSSAAETTAAKKTDSESDEALNSSITFSASGNPLYFPAEGEKSPYTGRNTIDHPYSYYTLSDKHQKIYDKIVNAMLDCETELSFSYYDEISFDDLFSVYQIIYNDEYRLFYISPTVEYAEDKTTSCVTAVHLLYEYDTDVIADMKEETEEEAKKILSRLTPDMSDYEIVKLFHDSVITTCTYSSEKDNPNSIYGCLVDKEALCQAYSQTFTYLCHSAGIRALTVVGVAGEAHMWNLVEMGGEYYHIDLTWDDPDRERNPDSVRYDYFGLTDERIRELRQVDDYDYEVPAANGTKYQYYNYNNLVAADVSEAKAIIIRETIEAAESGSSTVQFMCADREAYEKITSALFSNEKGNVITVLETAKKQSAKLFNTESVYHNSSENTLVIKIFLDYLD